MYNIIKSGLHSPYNTLKQGFKTTTKYAKATALGLMLGTSAEQVAAKSPINKEIAKTMIEQPKAIYGKLTHETPNDYKFKLITMIVDNDIKAGQFRRGLIKNQSVLMHDLNINSNQYKTYMSASETVGRGERVIDELSGPGCEEIMEEFELGFNKDMVEEDVFEKFGSDEFSLDRFHIKKPTAKEQQILDKYNIDQSSDKLTPEQRGIIAITHMAELDKYYPKYLAIMDEIRPNLNDENVKKSIANAKKLMANEETAEAGINALYNYYETFATISVDRKGLNIKEYSKQDVEDLKIYAQTFVLPKENFLVEMWDKHFVVPAGKYKDRACATILSLVKDGELKAK